MTEEGYGSIEQRLAMFNVAGDLVEKVYPEILVPRIEKDGDKITMVYPLPDEIRNMDDIRDKQRIAKVKRYFEDSELAMQRKILNWDNGVISTQYGKDFQALNTKKGKIIVQDGCVKSVGFKGWDIFPATYVTARLTDRIGYKK